MRWVAINRRSAGSGIAKRVWPSARTVHQATNPAPRQRLIDFGDTPSRSASSWIGQIGHGVAEYGIGLALLSS